MKPDWDYRIMAIDPSTRSGLGIAIGDVINGKLIPVYATTIDLMALAKWRYGYDDFEHRLLVLHEQVNRYLVDWTISLLACEDCYLGISAKAYRMAIMAIAVLKSSALDYTGHALQLLTPSVVKVYSQVPGNNGDKDRMAQFVSSWVATLPECVIDPATLDNHAIDALAILHACHRRLIE